MSLSDSFNLERFVTAQDPVIDRVMKELGAGAKRSHWMWFVFPQIAGLGSSSMAARYAIANLDEARAASDPAHFTAALAKYFEGKADEATLARI